MINSLNDNNKFKILFVCHGNIYRSPMAEFIMKKMVDERGVSGLFHIESAATSCEEIGNGVYPPAAEELALHGISCRGKRARRVEASDVDNFDFVIVMEDYNIANMRRLPVATSSGKLWKLLDFAGCKACGAASPLSGEDISDPWYHGRFSRTYAEIERGCEGLMVYLGF